MSVGNDTKMQERTPHPRQDARGGAPTRRDQAGTERRRAGAQRQSGAAQDGIAERLIAGVPARIMRPRLIFLCCLVALVAFGLLMVYSASAVEAASDGYAPTHYLERQALFALGGTILIVVMAFIPNLFDHFKRWLAWPLWGVALALLAAVTLVGMVGGGAQRWISLGFFTLQPSELLKPALILVVAKLLSEYYAERAIDINTYAARMAIAVGVPLVFIIVQPDLGTTLIIGMTVFTMMFLAGLPVRYALFFVAVIAVGGVLAMIAAPYRLQRFLVTMDPWADPYGDGYQATLAIMAFASGGLFGRGIGNSTIKYNYLPEAHNDYILAVIGEELGFVGTVLFFAVFALLIWSAFKIASESQTVFGRLVAEGCAVVLAVQFLVNALGIIGVLPMTGKTLPFISYGGSSMIASMILAGLILRASIESEAQTVYDMRRDSFAVMSRADAGSAHVGTSTAGEARPRRTSGFSVYDGAGAGGRQAAPAHPRTARPARDGSFGRVDLGPDSADRLRSRGPQVRRAPRTSSRRDRYDR